MSERKVSEVLNLAADTLEQRGWCQGGEAKVGADPWGIHNSGTLCLEGAIFTVARDIGDVEVSERGYPVAKRPYGVSGVANRHPAGEALREYLGFEPFGYEHPMPLYIWNDSKSRTQEEVIEALRAAALVAAAREAEVEVPA